MEYRRLGTSGLKVSELLLGTWQTFGLALDPDQCRALVRRAFDLGINAFDTADVYGRGRADQARGEALRDLPREQIVVATKVLGPVWDGPLGRGLSRKHIRDACDASLKRLEVEYIDLYQCHAPDPDTSLEETLAALDDLRRAGKVLYVGLSNFDAPLMADVLATQARHGFAPIVSQQPLYNLLDRQVEADLLPACARHGVGVIAYSPLAEGLLTGKYDGAPPPGSRGAERPPMRERQLTDARRALARAIAAAARDHGLPPARLALAWVLRRPEISGVITGATRVEQLEENVTASGAAIPPDLWERVDRLCATSSTP